MPSGREAAALTFTGVAAGYGARTLFEQVSFTANAGSPVGLIGPNGCGKSTLLAVAAGQCPAATGDIVRRPSSATVGYLAQEPIADSDYPTTVGDFLAAPEQLHQQLEVAAAALADRPGDEAAAARYARLLQRMTALPGNNDQAARVRAIFGVDQLPTEQALGQLSGGQKTRVALCRLALDDPAILLLDEPTNHLDLEMLARLERWLQEFRGALVLASHDRTLLDAVARHIVAIDPLALGARHYTGGYSDYAATVASARARQEQRYRTEQAQAKRMRRDIARTKEQARSVERSTTPRQPNVRRLAKKVARKATARERKLERFTSDPERATKLAKSYRLKIELGAATRSDRALRLDALTAGYPGAPPLLRNLSVDVGGDERICLIGANGAGKTTLLRTLAGALPPVGGEVQLAPSLHLGYLAQEQEPLDQAATALAALRAAAPLSETDARTFLHLFLFTGDDPLRPVGELSLGERTRLGLALLIAGGANCLLLDEPTNHLDIPSRERFEEALAVFAGPVIAVVHDRYFIGRFATTVWQLDAGGLTVLPGPQREA